MPTRRQLSRLWYCDYYWWQLTSKTPTKIEPTMQKVILYSYNENTKRRDEMQTIEVPVAIGLPDVIVYDGVCYKQLTDNCYIQCTVAYLKKPITNV